MKSQKINQRVVGNRFYDADNADFATLLPDEQGDMAYALFNTLPERAHRDRSSFAYPEDRETVDFVDERALHSIVEDLQFGHDLRLNF
jgi:hypothetical protein